MKRNILGIDTEAREKAIRETVNRYYDSAQHLSKSKREARAHKLHGLIRDGILHALANAHIKWEHKRFGLSKTPLGQMIHETLIALDYHDWVYHPIISRVYTDEQKKKQFPKNARPDNHEIEEWVRTELVQGILGPRALSRNFLKICFNSTKEAMLNRLFDALIKETRLPK